MPTSPQNDAGILSDPPRSVPSATPIIPLASAAAPPPVEPPAPQRRVPRIARAAEDLVEGVATRGELGRVGLAENDGASVAQPLDHERVRVSNVVDI